MIFQSLFKINSRVSSCSLTCNIWFKQFCQIPFKENKAVIVHDESNQIVSVSLRYINDELSINKLFNFKRRSTEMSSVALSKISEKISFHLNRKRTKKFPHLSEINIPVQLISKSNESVNDLNSISCIDSFANRGNYLKIGNTEYSLEINPPVITALELPKKCILSGFIVYPAKLEGLNYNIEESKIKWFRSKSIFGSYEEAKVSSLPLSKWEEIGEGYGIFITENEESRLLKVVVTPVQGELVGSNYEAISNVLITSKTEIKTEIFPFEKRHHFTSSVLSHQLLRVVSYNLLADFYANSNFSRSTLFPTCPEWALDISYRKQLFIKEILGYNADVICLQEVDKKIFFNDLKPIFSQYDLKGIFNSKLGLSAEGLAVFYRKQKLGLKEEKCYMLSQELETNPLFETLYEKVKQNESLTETFGKQKVVFQVCVFERTCAPTNIVLVGTTHLYSAADSDHIRLLQAWMCLSLLKHDAEKLRLENSQYEISVIFCGDFNSNPEDAAYRLVTTQHVDAQDNVWSSKQEEELKDLHLSQDLILESACGTPEYTNYTVSFKGCLDYIFYEKEKLSVEQVVSFPSHEEVTAHEALPSIAFPSDHLALIADFSWKNK